MPLYLHLTLQISFAAHLLQLLPYHCAFLIFLNALPDIAVLQRSFVTGSTLNRRLRAPSPIRRAADQRPLKLSLSSRCLLFNNKRNSHPSHSNNNNIAAMMNTAQGLQRALVSNLRRSIVIRGVSSVTISSTKQSTRRFTQLQRRSRKNRCR